MSLFNGEMLHKYDVRNKIDINRLRVNDRHFFENGEVRMLPLRMAITETQGYQHRKLRRSYNEITTSVG